MYRRLLISEAFDYCTKNIKLIRSNVDLKLTQIQILSRHAHLSVRKFHTSVATSDRKTEFLEESAKFLAGCRDIRDLRQEPPRVNRVYGNATTHLNNVQWYGLDFDYTFMEYTTDLQNLIYGIAKSYLIEHKSYPEALSTLEYDPHMTIRGLHFDKKTGYLMKLDQFGRIMEGTVYLGHQPVSATEIIEVYGGWKLSKSYIAQNMRLMSDLYSSPECTLLADVTQLFMDREIRHASRYLIRDIMEAIQHAHLSGRLHNEVKANPALYIKCSGDIETYLTHLRNAGKKLFLITNSEYTYVDACMKFALAPSSSKRTEQCIEGTTGELWTELFDVIVTGARKPYWFDRFTPFREIDLKTGHMSFKEVTELKKGCVYTEGGMDEFHRLLQIDGGKVLYMGDHIFSDLVAPSRSAQWKTVAIIKELEHEVAELESQRYNENLTTLRQVDALIDAGQRFTPNNSTTDQVAYQRILCLKIKRVRVRQEMKQSFNPMFGSVFRTFENRTYFFNQLCRYCDLYTSRASNLMHYNDNHSFYAGREVFPHER
eukprot:CFRG4199T1